MLDFLAQGRPGSRSEDAPLHTYLVRLVEANNTRQAPADIAEGDSASKRNSSAAAPRQSPSFDPSPQIESSPVLSGHGSSADAEDEAIMSQLSSIVSVCIGWVDEAHSLTLHFDLISSR